MSQVTLDIIRGIAQAAANAYDGALDDKGEPIKIGLRGKKATRYWIPGLWMGSNAELTVPI